jgi:hypothetical protein
MARKIGELLTESGLVTQAQLDAALKAQLFYGGHLGTCLMELGTIDEDSLGEALGRLFRVPYAPPKVLKHISADTIRALPRRLAEKYRAGADQRRRGGLHVSLIDPRNIQSLDEISFATGYRVKSWISPEARIYQALDRYYGLRRSARYINLCRSLEAAQIMRDNVDVKRRHEALLPPASVPRPLPNRMASANADAEGLSDLGGEYGYGRCWKEIAVDIGVERRRPEGARVEEVHAASQLSPPKDGTIHPTIWEANRQALPRGQEAGRGRRPAGVRRGPHGANDLPRSERRHRHGLGLEGRRLRPAPEVEGEVRGGRGAALRSDPGRRVLPRTAPSWHLVHELLRALGWRCRRRSCSFPIYFDDHLVAFFYGDGGRHGSVSGDTDEYIRLFRMFPMAVNQVVLRDSMRAIGYFFEPDPHATKKSTSSESLAGTP